MGNINNELDKFKTVPKELVFDASLSDRARFVYVFMACKPEKWEFYLEPMSKEIGYSVDTLRKYLGELVNSGWLEKGEQNKENGEFRAVKYTIKTTKSSDTENFRHGKTPTLNNSIPCTEYTSIDNNKKENIKEYKEKFADFVFLYKKMGGKVRSVNTEFEDFTSRHKDWKNILPYLPIAVQRETKARQQAVAERKFFPEPKMLKTYLGKQKAWELYVTIGEDLVKEEYTPLCGGSLMYNEYHKCYMYTGYWDGHIADGYTDDNRPDGAKVTLNNGRGTVSWSRKFKTWEKV